MSEDSSESSSDASPFSHETSWLKTRLFILLLLIDGILTIILTTPIANLQDGDSVSFSSTYKFYSTLIDLTVLSSFKIITALTGLLLAYFQRDSVGSYPFELYHRNGEKKSKSELEEEKIEEPFWPWFIRYIYRPSFFCEMVSGIFLTVLVLKCLARLNAELGVYDEKVPHHPLWWTAIVFLAAVTLIEMKKLESVTSECAANRVRTYTLPGPNLSDNENMLCDPLLVQTINVENKRKEALEENPNDVRKSSDISGDAKHEASFKDLIKLCLPDLHLLVLAFIFLLAAAISQIYIPKFTGDILDALTEATSKNNDTQAPDDVWKVPDFMSNILKLIIAALLSGIFAGCRGSIITLVGNRIIVRMRIMLMESLLTQEIGFFETTKSGHLTSRLNSDTTIVGEQISHDVNVFFRSSVQAIGVLIYMFFISWQLTFIAFISVPCLTFLSERFGGALYRLEKVMQKKLADGNAISQETIESMPTVRAFGAERGELLEYVNYLNQFLSLSYYEIRIYWLSNFCYLSLPHLVTALVLYYGGLLVLSNDITSGQLVTFLLYLTSLNDSFGDIGDMYTEMSQAVGAADKVFELIHRESQIQKPSVTFALDDSSFDQKDTMSMNNAALGIPGDRTLKYMKSGIYPGSCHGEVTLKNVDMFYPGRPLRKVLNNMNLKISPGSVVALVGASGSGKSSVVSLIEHLYDPSVGRICIDGIELHELSPEWLTRNVSIVSQEPKLFGRSIRRNIILGLEGTENEPSMADIKEAAEQANASSFIESMPDGYETDVGERGVQLSGGQKQRIAIARSLVRKPKILLLDEATSALDTESEACVQSAIDDMIKHSRNEKSGDRNPSVTVIIVAHRLSTIRGADLICVMEEGRIVEQGRHEDLISDKTGSYTNLVQRQLSSSL